MLKEAIQQIEKMSPCRIERLNNKVFSDKPMQFVTDLKHKPKTVETSGLGPLVSIVLNEAEKFYSPIYVEVKDFNEVIAYTAMDDEYDRQFICRAVSDVPAFKFDWKEHSEAMIAFRSRFIPNPDLDYVLMLLGKIIDSNSVTSEDNGLSQTVEVRKGVGLKDREYIRPIVKLAPYRTFFEIEQPESEFLLRLKEGGMVGLIEADGEMWRMESKRRIGQKLSEMLEPLVSSGGVIVTF